MPRGEAGRFHRRAQHRSVGKLPLNTNGGGLSYMHSGMDAESRSRRPLPYASSACLNSMDAPYLAGPARIAYLSLPSVNDEIPRA